MRDNPNNARLDELEALLDDFEQDVLAEGYSITELVIAVARYIAYTTAEHSNYQKSLCEESLEVILTCIRSGAQDCLEIYAQNMRQ